MGPGEVHISAETLDDLLVAETPSAVYQSVLRDIDNQLTADRVGIALQTAGGFESVKPAAKHQQTAAQTVPPALLELLDDVVETGKSCCLEDLTETRSTASRSAAAQEPPLRSVLCVPLADRGAIFAAAAAPNAFSETEQAYLHRLADRTTAALERFETARQTADSHDQQHETTASGTDSSIPTTVSIPATVLENLPIGILLEDESRVIRTVNSTLFEVFDVPGEPADLIGRDCPDVTAEFSDLFVDADAFQAHIDSIIDEGEPVEHEELALADGRTLERTYIPYTLPDGQANLWLYRDITKWKHHEQKLKALNQATQELMAATTREEVAETGVAAAEEILGLHANAIHLYDAESNGLTPVAATDDVYELVGEPPVFTAGDSIAWRVYEQGESTAIDDVRADPDTYNQDTPVRSELHLPLGGHGILLAGSPTPEAFDEQDMTVGEILAANIVGALEQVEREQQLRGREAELTRQNERLDEFASIVSHDLRNPLNVASGRLDLAAEECDSEHLDAIDTAHDRMEALIDGLLTLAREGDAATEMTTVQLSSVIEACWDHVETSDATLTININRAIRADESRLKQLIENLIRNAVDHGGDEVTVTVGELDAAAGFYMADTGPGISPAERERIFETGYSTAPGGTGFGLSIVKEIVEAHGWEIQVTESTTGGARFEITGVEFVDD